jgi:hypothetical protein
LDYGGAEFVRSCWFMSAQRKILRRFDSCFNSIVGHRLYMLVTRRGNTRDTRAQHECYTSAIRALYERYNERYVSVAMAFAIKKGSKDL